MAFGASHFCDILHPRVIKTAAGNTNKLLKIDITYQTCTFIATGKGTSFQAAVSDQPELILHVGLGSAAAECLKERERKSALECIGLHDRLCFWRLECVSASPRVPVVFSYASHVQSQT